MSRPCCMRHVGCLPNADFFKPAGIPLHALKTVTLGLDELEALRLADLNGLYQEEAAVKMKISRPTFSRIVEGARKKVADALIHGKALRLEGGAVIMKGNETMPARDGKGPVGGGQGLRRGTCGCGQQHDAQGQDEAGDGRHGRRRGKACCRAATAVKPVAGTSKNAENGKADA